MGSCESGHVDVRYEAGTVSGAELGNALLAILRGIDNVPVAERESVEDLKLCVMVGFTPRLKRNCDTAKPERPGTRISGGNVADGYAAEKIAYDAFCGRNGLERQAWRDVFHGTQKLELVKFHFGRLPDGTLAVIQVEAEAQPCTVTGLERMAAAAAA